MRTREGMAVARANGRLRGRQPKLSTKQQAELRRMHATGDYSVADLAELFTVSRPTVYRTLAAVETVPAQRSRRYRLVLLCAFVSIEALPTPTHSMRAAARRSRRTCLQLG